MKETPQFETRGAGRPRGGLTNFDWKNPDYLRILALRAERLRKIRTHPEQLPQLRTFYKHNPAKFISDWGITYDPRNIRRNLPAVIPFVLFKRQIEWIDWVLAHWRDEKPGLCDKSRDCGLSWLSVALADTLCLFYPGMAIGFGSRKEEYVDRLGAPKSLFFKARMFMEYIPPEFRGGWNRDRDAPHMRINFPESGSNISGEAGDNIGRGDRTGMYFVDESAYLERPELIDASLTQATNCRIDISSANGPANSFAEKRFSYAAEDVFTFHWRQDPRKDEAWYEKQVLEINNPVIVAQEIDINYSASIEGILIPSAWVQAAIGAGEKLVFMGTGAKSGALDVADEGRDTNAFCGAHGDVVQVLEEWSGKGGDIFQTVQRAFQLCDENGYTSFRYDADGLGAGVRGDARIVNQQRGRGRQIEVEAFQGSAAVFDPHAEDIIGRKNEDFFANAKAQAWWSLRTRFQKTYRAIHEGVKTNSDELISLRYGLPNLARLCTELSQVTYKLSLAGKVIVEKAPDGLRSPNLADALVMRFAPMQRTMVISDSAMAWAAGVGLKTNRAVLQRRGMR